MRLPFTVAEFLETFRRYNDAVWPAQFALTGVGVLLVVVAVGGGRRGARWIVPSGLAVLWFWAGAVYHLGYFARINPAARLFGAAFVLQAVLWIAWAGRGPDLRFESRARGRGLTGWVLVGYALVGYPALNLLLGHRYPAMPTFGAPCPTTIATFGLLAWATPRPAWFVWVVPVAWALIGGSAALALGVRADLGLSLAAVLAVVAARR